MGHVAIDGDIICYSVGFASEKKSYLVQGVPFQYKKEATAWCNEHDIDYAEITAVLDPEPVEYALSSVKRMIQHILDGSKCDTYTVYLTGDGNYREVIATIQPYKGSRKSAKPVHYDDIKAYLLTQHNAVIVEGEEADDAMSRDGMKGSVIATIDKDLNGTPGWHYNWNTKELYEVDEYQANQFFYTQMLTGDDTDDIPGIYKMVGRRATAALKAPIQEMTDPVDMYEYVRDAYRQGYDAVGMCLDERDEVVDRWLLEIGRLLYMRRKPGEMWTPPTRQEKVA